MPVRSSSSPVLRWPDLTAVHTALVSWARSAASRDARVARVGYFGSYAHGAWGVGSDLDVVLVVRDADLPFAERAAQWDLTALPVPAEALVYTGDEWDHRILPRADRFARVLADETVWVYP